jgi:hypothetical protein
MKLPGQTESERMDERKRRLRDVREYQSELKDRILKNIDTLQTELGSARSRMVSSDIDKFFGLVCMLRADAETINDVTITDWEAGIDR